MSTVKLNNIQVGQSATAAQNFTLYQPATPDGTVRLGLGNAGATTVDVASFSSAGMNAAGLTGNIAAARITTALNATGSAPIYAARAWVNFDGTTNVGGFCTIRASGNVTSVTDNGTGDYTVNFTTAMPDANYAVTGVSAGSASGSTSISAAGVSGNFTLLTTSARIFVVDASGNAVADTATCCIAIFR